MQALARLGDRVVVHREDPLVATVDDFLSPDECRMFIEHADGRMARASVAAETGSQQSEGRTNEVAWVAHDQTPAFRLVADRVAAAVGAPLEHAEAFQVIRYLPGTEYRGHFDGFLTSGAKASRLLARGGQRITTTLCYLNEVPRGGTTHFAQGDLTIEPQPGRLVVFNNCTGDGVIRDKRTLHAGTPVVRGVKWAFNLWFRQWPVAYDPVAAGVYDDTSDAPTAEAAGG